jgi:hypothetical protein
MPSTGELDAGDLVYVAMGHFSESALIAEPLRPPWGITALSPR